MKKNKTAFSLILAMWLVLIMSLLVLYILEYIIPYSKNVKWIENSSNAFYQAENSIEDWMLFFKTRPKITNEKSKNFWTNTVDYKYNTESSWTTIPPSWEWNSEFNKNYNIIAPWKPIQLKIGKKDWDNNIDLNNSNTKIYFKIPKVKSWILTLSWWNLAIINWQLTTNSKKTLNATGSQIRANQITNTDIDISNLQWVDLNWHETNNEKLWKFYNDNCTWTNSWCTLKMSIINKIELNNWTPLPYLEYKFQFNNKIPLRYSRIHSEWKSYGFHKYLKVRVPQQTTNQAFDFTIFQ